MIYCAASLFDWLAAVALLLAFVLFMEARRLMAAARAMLRDEEQES